MRQAGILAAGCLYALDHNVEKLKTDHEHALRLCQLFSGADWVSRVHDIETNIVLIDIREGIDLRSVIAKYEAENIRIIQFGPRTLRCVLHLDITSDHIHYVEEKTRRLVF